MPVFWRHRCLALTGAMLEAENVVVAVVAVAVAAVAVVFAVAT